MSRRADRFLFYSLGFASWAACGVLSWFALTRKPNQRSARA